MKVLALILICFFCFNEADAQLTHRLISSDTLKTFDIAYDFEGERMAAITHNQVLIWNTESYELVINKETPSKQLTSVVFHPTRNLLFFADFAGNVYQLDLEIELTPDVEEDEKEKQEKEKPQVVYKQDESIRRILFDRSGEALYIGDAGGGLQKINIYNWEVDQTVEANEGELSDMALDHQSEIIFTTGEDGTVKSYSTDSLKLLNSIKVSGNWVRRISLDRFKKLLAAAGDSGKLNIYSYQDGKMEKIVTIPQGHHNWVMGLDFHPIGIYLASAGHDNKLVIRRVPSDQRSLEVLEGLDFPEFKAPIHNFVGDFYPIDLTFQPTTSSFAIATLGRGIHLFTYEVVSTGP